MAVTISDTASGSRALANDTTPVPITIPAGTSAGDLLLAIVKSGETTARKCATPSGWTLVDEEIAGTPNLQVFKRVAEAGDASSTVNFTPTAEYCVMTVLVLLITDGNASDITLALADERNVGDDGVADCPTITIPNDASLLLRVAASRYAGTWATPSGYTEALDVVDTAVEYKSADAGATGTLEMTFSVAYRDEFVTATISIGPQSTFKSWFARKNNIIL